MLSVGTPENFDKPVQMGYTFINTGAHVEALCRYYLQTARAACGRDIVKGEIL